MLTTEASGSERAQRERPDRCDRCGGLLVWEEFEEGAGLAEGWRCVICGERLDPIIVKNRMEQAGKRGRGGNPSGCAGFGTGFGWKCVTHPQQRSGP